MPYRQIAAGLSGIAQTSADMYQKQLTQLQATQRAQSTLALQRNLRELDQVFMDNLHQQLQMTDDGIPITEDWLNEDFRQERLREMFDERMGEVRGMVSTPQGQMEFETRAEAMWQQYEFNWRDKSTAAMRAVNQAALPKNIQGIIEQATLDESDFSESLIDDLLREAVGSQTIPAERRGPMFDEAKKQLYNTLLRRFIDEPSEEDGTPVDGADINRAYELSVEKIDEHIESRSITPRHGDELKQAASGLREVRREQLYHGVVANATMGLRDAALEIMRSGNIVELNYALEMDALKELPEYETIGEENQRKLAQQINVEVGRLNQMLREAKIDGLDPGEHIMWSYKDAILKLAHYDTEAARYHLDYSNEDGLLAHAMNNMEDYPQERVRVLEWAARLHNNLREGETPIGDDPRTQAIFNSLFDALGIPRDSIEARRLVQALGERGPGRHEDLTPEEAEKFSEHILDQEIVKAMETGGWERLWRGDRVERLAERGIEFGLVAEGLHALSRSQLQAKAVGALLADVIRDNPQLISGTGTGKFPLELIQQAAESWVLGPNQEFKDVSPAIQNHVRNLAGAAAVVTEAIELSGGAAIAEGFMKENYTLGNIKVDPPTGNWIFVLYGLGARRNVYDRPVEAHVMIDATSPDTSLARLQILSRDLDPVSETFGEYLRRDDGSYRLDLDMSLDELRSAVRPSVGTGVTEEKERTEARTRTRPLE